MDQSKKTMRHFYCRDVLWETFEQMANDFDCSIDYLINEAMRYYARSKNYQSASGGAGVSANLGAPSSIGPGAGAGPPSQAGGARRPPPPTQPPSSGNAPSSQRRPAPATPGYTGGNASARQAPPTPAYAGAGGANFAAASSSGGGGGYAASAAQPYPSGGAAPATAPPAPSAAPAPGSTLFLIYNGQRYPVTKDQFIIGRGSKTSDLAIKDGNISRKHAAVIRRNGTFYIKDLGSTNGIDYKGMRIDNKRIDEGDVFHLCDYELRFTYRPE